MPKKEKRCEHTYWEWDPDKGYRVQKRCPHPYFSPGKHPLTGEDIDCCIFHASMDAKKDYVEQFWAEFESLFAQVKKRAEAAGTEEEKKNIWLECYGFVFPDTGDRFAERELPFSVNMWNAHFSGDAGFEFATFSGKAEFWNAIFSAAAVFMDATFSDYAGFFSATFSGNADFQSATFLGYAGFFGATFLDTTYFFGATFEEGVTFRSGYVTGTVNFEETEFLRDADFRAVTTDKQTVKGRELGPGAIAFDDAYFHLPDRVPIGGKTESSDPDYTRKTDLNRWSFHGTNIEKVRFVEPCWPKEKVRRGRKRTLDEERAEKGEISWAEAGEVYRKLRKNFEDNLAYEAAGDFHVGQMECRLRDGDRKLWDRGFTLAYRLVSGYGESVGRPLLWLLGFFALFTGFFLITGFPAADGSAVDWAWGFKGLFSGEWWGQLWGGISFTLRSSVSFAVPGYAENVDAKVGETLPALIFTWKASAVIIATLFVLALRRRFRR